MKHKRRDFISIFGTASVLSLAGCASYNPITAPNVKDVVEAKKKIISDIDCDKNGSDAILSVETMGTHVITKTEKKAEEIDSLISELSEAKEVSTQIKTLENQDITYYIVVVKPPNLIEAEELRSELSDSNDVSLVKPGRSIEYVNNYVSQVESFLEENSLLNPSTLRIVWPKSDDPINVTAMIQGVNQIQDLVDDDLIEGRVLTENGEKTVFSTSDLSKFQTPFYWGDKLHIEGEFLKEREKQILSKFRETNLITDSGPGDNKLQFYVKGKKWGDPLSIAPDLADRWNEENEMGEWVAMAEKQKAVLFKNQFSNIDLLGVENNVIASLRINLC